jgi:hypothetical protein
MLAFWDLARGRKQILRRYRHHSSSVGVFGIGSARSKEAFITHSGRKKYNCVELE